MFQYYLTFSGPRVYIEGSWPLALFQTRVLTFKED